MAVNKIVWVLPQKKYNDSGISKYIWSLTPETDISNPLCFIIFEPSTPKRFETRKSNIDLKGEKLIIGFILSGLLSKRKRSQE